MSEASGAHPQRGRSGGRSAPGHRQTLLIYDGECGFCRWGMRVVRGLDRRDAFRFCPFGHPVAESHLAGLPPGGRHTSFHAVKDGVLASATAAARVMLEQLPFGRLSVALGVHLLYPLVASNRWLLGRFVSSPALLDTCSDRRTGDRAA